MTLPVSIAEKLISMLNGVKIPFSSLKHPSVETMIDNGILKKQIQGRTRAQIYLTNREALAAYLANHFGIDDLENYVRVFRQENLSRADFIDISANSKLKPVRTFKGFLVNCFQPVECKLNGQPFTIQPKEGTFAFIYDYETFTIPAGMTIVGIENPENFRQIQKQRNLFADIEPLFASRYPQNRDLVKWLQMIPNPYLHFGDFDYAGLNIYFNEYRKHLKSKARFFVPPGIEHLLATKGNRENYSNQTIQFDKDEIEEENILVLLRLIEKYRKGLEQEIFAG